MNICIYLTQNVTYMYICIISYPNVTCIPIRIYLTCMCICLYLTKRYMYVHMYLYLNIQVHIHMYISYLTQTLLVRNIYVYILPKTLHIYVYSYPNTFIICPFGLQPLTESTFQKSKTRYSVKQHKRMEVLLRYVFFFLFVQREGKRRGFVG